MIYSKRSTFSLFAKYFFQAIYNFFSYFIFQGFNPEISWKYIYDKKEIFDAIVFLGYVWHVG